MQIESDYFPFVFFVPVVYHRGMNEFFTGLIVGASFAVVIGIVLAVKNAGMKKDAKAEVEKYKKMLTDRMELETEGIQKLKAENEELRKANENFRVSIQTMSQKPGRKELQRLEVYQTAAERLTMNSPGFAPVWQAALKESEEEFRKTFVGLTPFLRKHVSLKANDVNLIDADED